LILDFNIFILFQMINTQTATLEKDDF